MSITDRITQNFLNKIFDDANAFILYLDVLGNILACNKKVENFLGRKNDEITGHHYLDILFPLLHQDTKQVVKTVIEDALKNHRPNIFEATLTDKQNSAHLVSWNITPMTSDAQELEGILFIGSDLTDLKQEEESLRRVDETIRNILSSVKEYGIYVIDLEGNITYYGLGAESIFGWRKDEVLFKHVSILHTPQDTKGRLPFILDQTRQLGRYEEPEISLVKKDKQEIPVILTAIRFHDAQNNLTGYIFIAKDITERKKLEDQVFQAEKMATLGQLVAGMAHEINNPLFVISARLDMLLAKHTFFNRKNKELLLIKEQADRIRHLVDQLLRFARYGPLKLEKIDLNKLLDNIIPLLLSHKLVNYSKVEIKKDFEKGLATVKADLSQLQEVFLNLCMNSCQAMPNGGKLTLKTSNLPNNFVEVRISDTGCGIHEDNLKKLFTPFFSTKEDGLGLGLSICYNIISAHNGFIGIQTAVDKGTTVIVKLPFA